MALHSRLVLPDAAVRLHCRLLLPDAAVRILCQQRQGQQHLSCHGAPASNISAATAPPASISFPMALCYGAQASNSFPMALSHGVQAGRPAALPRRPCQHQTSFGGEEYSGLASNLAHLVQIC